MRDASSRPMGRFCYWVLTVVVAMGFGVEAARASPILENGPATTTVADTVYMADRSKAKGSLIITWPDYHDDTGNERRTECWAAK